jgi:hypothetical protein
MAFLENFLAVEIFLQWKWALIFMIMETLDAYALSCLVWEIGRLALQGV